RTPETNGRLERRDRGRILAADAVSDCKRPHLECIRTTLGLEPTDRLSGEIELHAAEALIALERSKRGFGSELQEVKTTTTTRCCERRDGRIGVAASDRRARHGQPREAPVREVALRFRVQLLGSRPEPCTRTALEREHKREGSRQRDEDGA